MSNKLRLLNQFMQKYRLEANSGIPCTNILMEQSYSSYNIPDAVYLEFLELYADAIIADCEYYIIEKQKPYGPIVIDIDLKQSINRRYYTETTLRNLVKIYNKIIRNYIDVPANRMIAYVLEKKTLTVMKSDEFKDGFHIIYPYICIRLAVQKAIRLDVIKEVTKRNLFQDCPLLTSETTDKIIDMNSGWLLYGSKKHTTSAMYSLTHIYQQTNRNVMDTLIPGDDIKLQIRYLIKTLSIRKFMSDSDIDSLQGNRLTDDTNIFDCRQLMLEHVKKFAKEPEIYIMLQNHKFTYFHTYQDLCKNLVKLSINNRYYVDEIILDGRRRKPYLDLEHYYSTKKAFIANYKPVIDKLIKDVITVFQNEYHETITRSDILLLDSSGKEDNKYKLSLHLIVSPKDRHLYYSSGRYTTSAAFHFYAALIKLDPFYQKFKLDPLIYATNSNFRIIGSYKAFGCDRFLQPIDTQTLIPLELKEEEKLDYLVTYIREPNRCLTTPIIEQSATLSGKLAKNKPTKTNIHGQLIKYVKAHHPSAKYMGLYKNVFHNFTYEDRSEPCPISGHVHDGTNGFYVVENSRGYYLKCFSDRCKGSKHIGYADITNDFIESAYQINQPYLITNETIEADSKDLVESLITKWLTSDSIKTLAIKSAMGTGKTTMIEKLLQYDTKLKKILWITHRQSLTKQIHGTFKQYKFKNYMNSKGSLFSYLRIIIQIDSINRIQEYKENKIVFNQYDLVIIDEVEGNLNHYQSPFLQRPDQSARDKFNFVTECIKCARKLLVLDADFAMRSKLFVDHMGKSIIINNNFMPWKKIFNITRNQKNFCKEMIKDLKKGLNICVVTMSATFLESFKHKLDKLGIKYIMHTSHTDDKLKDNLENVNESWIMYQLVAYSPAVESGVDFNRKHFHKIYCVLKDGPMTCSQRAFLQMVGRVRQVDDHDILCYYPNSINLTATVYTFDDLLSYFRHYEDLNGKKILENVEYTKEIINGTVTMQRKQTDISLFDYISIYNEVEQLNRHPTTFMTVLNKLIQRAGHEMRIIDTETTKIKLENTCAEDIVALDETEYDINVLLKKQAKNQLTAIEKMVLNKISFMETFGINNSCNKKEFAKFYQIYCTKQVNVKRFERFFGFQNIDHNIDNYDDGKDRARHKLIIDIINRMLGQNKQSYCLAQFKDKILQEDHYKAAIKDIMENSLYFANEEKNRALFFKSKCTRKTSDTLHCIHTVQTLLASYSVNLKRVKRKQVNKKVSFEYSLSVNKQIKNIVQFKYNETDTVKGFPEIFRK